MGLFHMTSVQIQLLLVTFTSTLEFVHKICISLLKVAFDIFPIVFVVYKISREKWERYLNNWHYLDTGVPSFIYFLQ